MSLQENRKETFIRIFDSVPVYKINLLTFEMLEDKWQLFNIIINNYAPEMKKEKESVIGYYDYERNPHGNKGILFTKYKIYYKKKKKTKSIKIWYDEIKKIRLGLFDKRLIVIITDEKKRYVLKTTKTISKGILSFVETLNDINEQQLIFDYNQEQIDISDNSVGKFSGYEIGKRKIINRGFEEEKFHARQGHGFAAERANDMYDKFHGKKVKIVGDNNVKDGADRIEYLKNGSVISIQTKYCKTASASVDACFNENGFRYFNNGKPMLIEVPSDQYEAAVKAMQKKIELGQMGEITDPNEARNIIKKGSITYQQAVNIAKAGTIESLTYDAINGVVASTSAFGISAIVSLATSVWNGDELYTALKCAIYTGFKIGGATFITSVLVAQLSKAGLNSALVPASDMLVKALGNKTSAAIINAFRGNAKHIYGAAAMKSAAKILRINIITSVITLFVFSFGDLVKAIRKRISWKQFIKNFSILGLSIFAGFFGGMGGAVIGTAILPGIGSAICTTLGAILASLLVSHIGKKILGQFIKDDVEEMENIINNEFMKMIDENLLTKNEAEKIMDKLNQTIKARHFGRMMASQDREEYARKLLIPILNIQLKKRKTIIEPSVDDIGKTIDTVLEMAPVE